MKPIAKIIIPVMGLLLTGCYPYENSHSGNNGYDHRNQHETHHGQDTQSKDHRENSSGQYHQDGRH